MIGNRPRERDRYTVGIARTADGHAVKSFGAEANAEYIKGCAVEAALADTQFRAPHIFRLDAERGQVEFEFIEDTALLQEHFEQVLPRKTFRQALRLNDDAARLLAMLHQRLSVSNARDWEPPAFLLSRAQRIGVSLVDIDQVFLHCDYSAVNLLVDSNDRLAVIDPSPNSYFTKHACLQGPRFVDIATYTARLIWPYRLRSYSPAWRKLAFCLRRRFIETYARTTGSFVDPDMLRLFEYSVVRSFIEYKTTNRLIRSAALGIERTGLYKPAMTTVRS